METNALFIEVKCKAGGFVGRYYPEETGGSNLASQ